MSSERHSTGESERGSHLASSLASCARRYGYRYLLGLEPRARRDGMARGTCNHLGLDAYYRGKDPLTAIMGANKKDAHMAIEAVGIVEAYTQRYPIDWSGPRGREELGEIVFVEEEFTMLVGGDESMTRRLDLGLVNNKGLLFVLDHKTAARIGEKLKKVRLDMTLFTQAIIGKRVVAPKYGLKWGGVVLNMLPTTPDAKKFHREFLQYSQEFLNENERSIHYWLRQESMIRSAFDRGELDPWDLTKSYSCYPQGYSCDYQSLCIEGKRSLHRYDKKDE